jgi:hypothetical protein
MHSHHDTTLPLKIAGPDRISARQTFKLRLEPVSTDEDDARQRPPLRTRVGPGGDELSERNDVGRGLDTVLKLTGDEAQNRFPLQDPMVAAVVATLRPDQRCMRKQRWKSTVRPYCR